MTIIGPVRSRFRLSRSGTTLLEVAVAAVLMAIMSIAGASYFYYARLSQIRNMQEVIAHSIAEVQLERFREQGYGALEGYTTPSSLPYGYNFDWAVSQQTAFPATVTVEGITYRISASMLYNASTSGADYRWEVTVGGVLYRYRRVIVRVEWGANFGTSITLEGRIGE